MKIRIITAAVLVPVLLVVVLALPKIVTALVLSAFCGIAVYELLHSTALVRNIRLLCYTAAAAALVPVWCYFGCPQVWGLLGTLLFVVVLFAEMMASGGKLYFEKISLCLTAGLLIPYLFSAMVRIHSGELGRYLIMIPCILAFIPDSGAYFIGCFFGKHKLAPTISPKKTVEGAVGGVLTAVLGMLLYAFILDVAFGRTVSYGYALVFGVVVSVGDIFGDLMFSLIKRQTGIKDYGNLFPGHGGILDRFDSMIVVAPLTEALLILLPMVV